LSLQKAVFEAKKLISSSSVAFVTPGFENSKIHFSLLFQDHGYES
jgi:hypothetical protein